MEKRNRASDTTSPDIDNVEQEDGGAQAQTVADEAIDRATAPFGIEDSEKPAGDPFDPDDTQDLVDHMNQMVSSGRIDMSAYRGEDNLDDQEDMLGEDAKPDKDLPGES